MTIALVLTCEHAVNTVPPEFARLFTDDSQVLETHRGVDIGAKAIADHLAQHLSCAFYHSTTISRLLIDCNRKLTSKSCFSSWSDRLSSAEKKYLIETYYQPFREPVIQNIAKLIEQKKCVLHFSIHSFTPILDEETREAEIGLLYDPQRALEKNVATQLKTILEELTPHYRIRFNYPYLGTSDGFTTFLRSQFDEQSYIGLEIEMNQALMSSEHTQQALMRQLTQAIRLIRLVSVDN